MAAMYHQTLLEMCVFKQTDGHNYFSAGSLEV